jgi:hypothetical protein
MIIHEDLSLDVIKAAEDVFNTPVRSVLSQTFVKRLVSASLGKEVGAFVAGVTSTVAPTQESWDNIRRKYEAKKGNDARLFALQDSFMERKILKNVSSRLRIRSLSPTAMFLEQNVERFSCVAEDTESTM